MVILIIGGEYGSAASGEKKDDFKEYMSVTRNEFRAAVESGIPIFVMIDKKVMAEYGVYEANYDDIEKENRMMAFPATKNINVFRSIKEIKGIVTLPIQEFERSSDIKGFISKQWADMFKNYLSSLRNEKEKRKIGGSVNEMKALIQKMDVMLKSLGENVLLKDNPDEYKEIINKQEILEFCYSLINNFGWYKDDIYDAYYDREEFITRFLDCLLELKEDLAVVIDIFDRHEIKPPSFFWGYDIDKKMDLLSKTQNKKAVIKIMIKDEYFLELIKP